MLNTLQGIQLASGPAHSAENITDFQRKLLVPYLCILKTEEALSFEAFVNVYQTTPCHMHLTNMKIQETDRSLGLQELEPARFVDSAHGDGKVVSLTPRPPLPPRRDI